jgi:hypothetical protein
LVRSALGLVLIGEDFMAAANGFEKKSLLKIHFQFHGLSPG